MLNYFNSSEIIRITKQLKDILAEFEAVKTKRARLCAGSYSSHEENIYNSQLDPSSYYLFRFLDKSVTITRNYHYRDVPHYMITLENWNPTREFDLCNKLSFDIQTNSYGDFIDLNEALNAFKDFCLWLIKQEFNLETVYQYQIF